MDRAKLSRIEKEILQEAAKIVANHLADGEAVFIERFGKFYLTPLRVPKDPGAAPAFWIDTVRFKPFQFLKKQMQRRRILCEKLPGAAECFHPDGKGHAGDCIDFFGKVPQ